MTYLSALLPAREGLAVYAALNAHANSQHASGAGDRQARTRGQVMADTLVERVTGKATADAVPIEVGVVINDDVLFGERTEPAVLEGYGPVPAPLLRSWLRDDTSQITTGTTTGTTIGNPARAWLRRLYWRPADGALVAMDSKRRRFEGQLRRFVVIRDQHCRTRWCDAPIRHVDHPVPVARGGTTSAANRQGLCEACNYTKEAPGWETALREDGAIETTTPTGHRHRSYPPGTGPPPIDTHKRPPLDTEPLSRIEMFYRDLILAS